MGNGLVNLSGKTEPLFLCFQLTTPLGKGATETAELTSMMIGKSDKTIREWRSKVVKFHKVSWASTRGLVYSGRMKTQTRRLECPPQAVLDKTVIFFHDISV
jgi:hypothetical protein